jgi:uroporphyrinogen decarboxylase
MNAKENFLRAIHFDQPPYVPRANEGFMASIESPDNFRLTDWTDRWGVGWKIGIEGFVPFPKNNPLPSLDRLDDFPIPDPDALTFDEQSLSALTAPDRAEKIVLGDHTYLLFERGWSLMGMDNFLMAFHTHPQAMRALLRRIADFNIRVFDRFLEMGVDGVTFSEDLGTQRALMMSPGTFRDFILPEYKRCFASVLAAGKIIHFHSCGCVHEIVGDLADAGVTILNPIQARANDLHKVKAATYGKMALWGGIDSHLLMTGTPAQVTAEVQRVLSILAPGGGFVIGPDQGMPFPEENLRALYDAAIAHGRYPV